MATSDPTPVASARVRSPVWTVVSIVIGVVAAAAAVWLVVGDAGARDAVGRIDAGTLAIVLALLSIGVVVTSWFFRLVLPHRLRRRVDGWAWHHLFAVGRLLNLVVPQAGMAYRAARLRVAYGIPISTFVGSLAVINWLGSAVAAAMAGVVLLASGAITAGAVVLGAGIVLLVLLVVAARVRVGSRRWTTPQRVSRMLRLFGESFRDLARVPGTLIRLLMLSILGQVLTAAAYVVVCDALGVAEPLVVGTVIYAGSAVVSIVTLTPGSLGVTELVAAAAGSALDVGAGIGVIVALVIRVVGAVAVGLLALAATAAGGSARATAVRTADRGRGDRPLRVVHVASSYPFDAEDTTAPFMAEMVQAVAAEGVRVSVIVPDAPGMEAGMRNGVEVIPYRFAFWRRRTWGHGSSQRSSGRLRPASVVAAPLAMLAMVRTLRRVIRQERPDVVHLHWLIPQGVLARFVPHSIPVVLSVHGAGVRLAVRRRPVRFVARWAMGRVDHVVAPSGAILAQLASIASDTEDRVSILEHGADGTRFAPATRGAAREGLGIGADEFLVLAVGRLVPLKGFADAITAVGTMGPGARLVIAGGGPQREELAEMAERLAPGRVDLVGPVVRSALARWYSAADVVVLPSVHGEGGADTGPVVLVEALASGRPVVATRVGMAARLIMTGVNGHLVPEGDPEAIAAALGQVRSAMGSMDGAARTSFEHHGGWDRVGRELVRRYEVEVTARAAQPM